MSRGEVGDTLRYFEAGQMEAVMSRGNSRKLTRGQSSNSLKPSARGMGLNPEALFSVAAIATAPGFCEFLVRYWVIKKTHSYVQSICALYSCFEK